MEKYRIKSRFLSAINEAIKKVTMTEDNASYTEPSMDKDGNFFTDIISKNEPQIKSDDTEVSKLNTSNMSKEELVQQAIKKLKASLNINTELDNIINQIKELDGKESNEWIINKDQNDLYLQSKNAHIFKQNSNLCLSHNGMVEIFKSVAEMKDWLLANEYPEVPPVTLYESTNNG